MACPPFLPILAYCLLKLAWLAGVLTLGFWLTASNWLFDVRYSQLQSAQAQLQGVRGEIEQFRRVKQRLPVDLAELLAWRCGHLSKAQARHCARLLHRDSWNKPVHYTFPGRHSREGFDLWIVAPAEHSHSLEIVGNW
ncbi:type II secretion system protein GspG [Chitinimonas lacunae]|uniref:Type II secretion system protein GspG n=1 Tax=Chitinimonas lacunae TaxID=1963018 RepID=A0ABV8MSL4_9NEIS